MHRACVAMCVHDVYVQFSAAAGLVQSCTAIRVSAILLVSHFLFTPPYWPPYVFLISISHFLFPVPGNKKWETK